MAAGQNLDTALASCPRQGGQPNLHTFFTLAGTPCNDGDASTDNDVCDANGNCQGVDLCVENNVVCQRAGPCFSLPTCANGVCGESLPLPFGSSCDDGDVTTTNEQCVEDNVCEGERLCLGVECPVVPQCYEPSVCDYETGNCTLVPATAGTPCDDGLNRTSNDVCSGNGTCAGVDLCEENDVVCEPRSQCHLAGTCFRGVCSEPLKENGASCDDGNALTLDDVCIEGRCNGVDPCDGVDCPALGPCYLPGTCSFGNCSQPLKEDGVACDDGSILPYFDSCTAGLCAGNLPCGEDSACVAWRRKDGVVETGNYGLARTQSGSGWNAGAFSSRLFTPADPEAGVEFVPTRTDRVSLVGLGTHPDNGNGYQDVEFGMYLTAQGNIFIYEGGTYRSFVGQYQAGSTLAVAIGKFGRAEYYNNGELVYRSSVMPIYPLGVDVALYQADAALRDFAWITKQDLFCRGVTCSGGGSACRNDSVCALGECVPGLAINEGETCDVTDVCRQGMLWWCGRLC